MAKQTKSPGRVRDWLPTPLRAARAAVLAGSMAFREALFGMAAGSVSTADANDLGWRPITQRVGGKEYRRDLNPLSQDQMLRVSHYLYSGNALAQFCINIPVALVIGRSLTYTLEFDDEVLGWSPEKSKKEAARCRRFLDQFWENPAHNFKRGAARYAKTYLVTGELLLLISPESINPSTGLFGLDYIDSQLIDDVQGKNGLATTPGKVMVRKADTTPQPFDVMLPTADGRYEGECFFFRHVGRLNSLRGMSDLIAQADWIDLHDQLLFGRVDKAILSNTLVHDILVEGGTAESIKEQVQNFLEASVKPGGAFGHNEKVTHNIKTADLKESDAHTLVRSVLLHVLGSKGFPEHWFSNGGNSNKASSGEQSDTAYKVLEELQEELSEIFATPLMVAYDKLAEKQGFPARDTGAVRLHPDFPKISEKDISRMGGVMANVEASLDAAVSAGRISKRTAQRVSLTLIEKITGEHVDPDDEAAQIETEQAADQATEQERQNVAARAAADLVLKLGDGNGGGASTDPTVADPAGQAVGKETVTA